MPITIYDGDGPQAQTVDFATTHEAWLANVSMVFAHVNRVGVIAPTSVAGIGVWLALLLAGKTPIMLQYPTPKLSRAYWAREIAHSVETLRIEGLAYMGAPADPGLAIPGLDLTRQPIGSPTRPACAFGDGHAAQLSSGTTGHRKGVSLTMREVSAHVSDYNQVLRLGAEDCIISWLPLYHDMGFITALLMPAMLDVPVVMVDPVAWVRRPQMLFELIERHRGTVCFMPNFGFEVMARQAGARAHDLSSMRLWVSCSEPTRIGSMNRFVDAAGIDASGLANCYAMAENIFAVTQRTGLATRAFGDVTAVSCGKPIPGVDLKIADGEVWVRSPYSLKAYEGGQNMVDEEGYYPTGDIGEIVDGDLFILGRRRDVMIHAGRKIVLSDLDYELGRLLPESAGRIAAVTSDNQLLGTEEPVCLIEDARYWAKNHDAEALTRVQSETGLESARVEFVAPGFITKTSSGKINRQLTGEHWAQMRAGRTVRAGSARRGIASLRAAVEEIIPGVDPQLPLDSQLDSLGLVNVSLLLSEYGLEDSLSLSLNELRLVEDDHAGRALGPVIRVVSLFDADWLLPLMRPVLSALGRQLGVSIQYEHVCSPPASILLSDLTFEDQFAPRDRRDGVYNGLSAALRAIRTADLVITDDLIQMAWPAVNDTQYPKISHRFEAQHFSDLMCVRWARYSDSNHLIATEFIESESITPDRANQSLDDLEDYLGVPVLRVALTRQYAAHTEKWVARYLRDATALLVQDTDAAVDYNQLAQVLLSALTKLAPRIRRAEAAAGDQFHGSDQPHWCSWLVNQDLVDFVLDHYDSFLVLGKRASIPYLASEATRRGKSIAFRSDLVCPPTDDYDCVLQTGSWGKPSTDRPLYPLMLAGWGNRPLNVPESIASRAPPNTVRPLLSGRLTRLDAL